PSQGVCLRAYLLILFPYLLVLGAKVINVFEICITFFKKCLFVGCCFLLVTNGKSRWHSGAPLLFLLWRLVMTVILPLLFSF
ncbi:MAG: hypothetical protein SPD82_09495, partial [Prevotella sp.]|nr:hypothetical protein [Prevotella sp.]